MLPSHEIHQFRLWGNTGLLLVSVINYCQFRGMLMKSVIHFRGTAGFTLFNDDAARLIVGDHPRMQPLKPLNIQPPLFTAFRPDTHGVLDDHIESWFISAEAPIEEDVEDLESVVDLCMSEEWPPPPDRDANQPAPVV